MSSLCGVVANTYALSTTSSAPTPTAPNIYHTHHTLRTQHPPHPTFTPTRNETSTPTSTTPNIHHTQHPPHPTSTTPNIHHPPLPTHHSTTYKTQYVRHAKTALVYTVAMSFFKMHTTSHLALPCTSTRINFGSPDETQNQTRANLFSRQEIPWLPKRGNIVNNII